MKARMQSAKKFLNSGVFPLNSGGVGALGPGEREQERACRRWCFQRRNSSSSESSTEGRLEVQGEGDAGGGVTSSEECGGCRGSILLPVGLRVAISTEWLIVRMSMGNDPSE